MVTLSPANVGTTSYTWIIMPEILKTKLTAKGISEELAWLG